MLLVVIRCIREIPQEFLRSVLLPLNQVYILNTTNKIAHEHKNNVRSLRHRTLYH